MIVEMLPVGPLQANCIIIGCEKTRTCAVVDPGAEPERILREVARLGLRVVAIINTHGHADHMSANNRIKHATGAPIMIGEKDAEMLTSAAKNLSLLSGVVVRSDDTDRLLEDGDVIDVGEVSLKVLETPGHTPGGICLVAENKVFTGDTLFAGSVGRTDFPGGSMDDLLSSIKDKLLTLGDDVEAYPGHGPTTTIGEEKRYNPFLG